MKLYKASPTLPQDMQLGKQKHLKVSNYFYYIKSKLNVFLGKAKTVFDRGECKGK